MALFHLKKKKEEETCACGCCGAAEQKTEEGNARILVLGSGCKKCNELEANVKEALKQLQMELAVGHVTDFSKIAAYGVMTTPALVIDGKVASSGKVLQVEEAKSLLQKMEGEA